MEFHDFRLLVERSLWLLLEKSANVIINTTAKANDTTDILQTFR